MFNKKLQEENKILREQIEVLKKYQLPMIDYGFGDPSPENKEDRVSYVARAAGFFQDVMFAKIKNLISEQQNSLSNPMNVREYDLFVKGSINALSLLLDWGDEMVNEHLANINNNKEENGEI